MIGYTVICRFCEPIISTATSSPTTTSRRNPRCVTYVVIHTCCRKYVEDSTRFPNVSPGVGRMYGCTQPREVTSHHATSITATKARARQLLRQIWRKRVLEPVERAGT